MLAQDAPLKTLHGHVPEVVRHLSAKGDLTATNQLNLAIGLPLRDKTGLDEFLTQLYEPGSSNYHRFLTPEQFTASFGPSEADYAAVTDFARRNNLSVTHAHDNRLLLDVSGSVEDIQKALHITLRTYSHPTEAREFYAPDSEPMIDASIPISDISGLNNYLLSRPKSLHAESALANSVTPHTGSASDGGYLGKDFRAAYYPGGALTGSGQTVGLLEFDGFYASDITSYETAAGYSAVPLQTVLLDGYSGTPTTGADSGNGEVSLDIELAIAMAPGLSKIVVFEAGPSGSPNDLLNAMASSNQIKQFSSSWGWSGGPSATTDNIFKEMAAQGQSFFSAVGDSDAFTVGSTSANGADNTSLDNAPSTSPYITVVGGTTLSTSGAGGAWSLETVWNWGLDDGNYVGTSGGVSSYYAIPIWQSGLSMTANGGSTVFRNTPDVALTADNVHVVYGNGSTSIFGGTSCAAPLWAAVTALMNQQAASSGASTVGFINPAIYAIGKGAAYGENFHDITTGNNFSTNSPANYDAVTGFDLCTGWGTPEVAGLINSLVGPPDPLGITTAASFAAIGPVGGPFSVSSQIFTLTNLSGATLPWSAASTAGWLNVTPSSGVLAAHAAANVTVGLNAAAYNLIAGSYATNVTFSNLTTLVAQSDSINLEIGQSIVQNGGFETGDFSDWTLSGHTVVRSGHNSTVYNAVEATASTYQVAHSGNYGAFLGDDQPATLSQTLPTVVGQKYLVSLWLENSMAGPIQTFAVNWNGGNIYNSSNPPVFAWTNLQFIVTAAGTNTALQINAENQPNYFGLDDVSVTPIPAMTFRSAVKAANSFSLTWSTAAGLTYQVQYATDLLHPNWINLGSPTVATGSSLTVSDTNGIAASAQRFYRLVVTP